MKRGRSERRPAESEPTSGGAGDAAGAEDDIVGKRTYHCDVCGSVMLDLHCKLICQRCGYRRDCSDP